MISETISIETKFIELLMGEIRKQEARILRGPISGEQYASEKAYLKGLDAAIILFGDARKAVRGTSDED